MTKPRLATSLRAALALAICLVPIAAAAAPTPDQSCRAAKLKAAGKYAAAVASCHAKAATDASAPDPECLSKAAGKIVDAFAKADTEGGCAGLEPSSSEDVEALVAAVIAAAPSIPGGGKCPSGIYKAGGKLTSAALGGWSKFVTSGDAAKRDASIAKATTKLGTSVGKAEEKDGCAGTGQAPAVENAVDSGIEPLLDCLAGMGSCAEEVVDAGETVTTDADGDGPDAETPVVASVETPVAGTVSMHIVEAGMPPSGYEILGLVVQVEAPDASAASPLVLTFTIDVTLLPPDPMGVVLFRNGVVVSDCTGAAGVADPDPCVDSRTIVSGGDLEIVALSSQASDWAAGVPEPPTTTTTTLVDPPADHWMRWQVRADKTGSDVATEIDIGWTGATHNLDPVDGSAMRFGLNCPSAALPSYGECSVTGFDPAEGNCRCANNPATVCDEPLAADADDCGGSTCTCYTRPPFPNVAQGTTLCMVGLASSDASGTWNPDTGAGDVVLNELMKLHLGISLMQPCPVCVGDATPNDGVKGGTCDAGQTPGAGCDSNGSDPTYPYPGGGSTSLDCLPSNSSNISGLGMKFPHVESTGAVSMPASVPCLGNPAEDCPCAACTFDSTIGCSSDAECLSQVGRRCSLAALETCTTDDDCASFNAGNCHATIFRCVGAFSIVCATNGDCTNVNVGPCADSTCTDDGTAGTAPHPNSCSDATCTAGVDDEGTCNAGPINAFCDGIVEEDGKGVAACFNNSDCASHTPPAGSCTNVAASVCFPPTVAATGAADPGSPRTVAALCLAPTSNTSANAASGLPGPVRLRTDWTVTYGQ